MSENAKSLSNHLKMWRADRPDEWKMDEFIRQAEELQAEVERLRDGFDRITGTIKYMQEDDSTKETCLKILRDIATEYKAEGQEGTCG